MFTVLGSSRKACDGVNRREMLQAGGLSLLGLNALSADSSLAAEAAVGQVPRAKNVILLFLYGAVSQLETFDPKPGAPSDIRGPFKPISTSVPGIQISEHLPRLAKSMHRVSLVRSMTHPHPIHGVAYAVTGIDRVDIPMELNRHDTRHWPYFGSVLDYLHERNHNHHPKVIPRTMHLPWVLSSRSVPHQRAGMFGGFLGSKYNPVVAEFSGTPTNSNTFRPKDPYGGIDPDGKFEILDAGLPQGVTLDRLNRRHSLLEQFDLRRELNETSTGASFDRYHKMAMSITASPELRNALDLSAEPSKLREQYGHHLFGQSTLLARRLLEAGSRVVSVFWDEFGRSCGTWDTHQDQTRRLKNELCPGFDQAFTTLLDDLRDRGMLEETLILVLSEHGRTPKAERRGDSVDGRGHWSSAYSCMFAGAGIAQGNVVGVTDRDAAHVLESPVSPKDILHTTYHLLGIDSHQTIPDRLGRPAPLVAEGKIVRELLAT